MATASEDQSAEQPDFTEDDLDAADRALDRVADEDATGLDDDGLPLEIEP